MKPPPILQALSPDWIFEGVPEALVRKVSRHSEFHQRGHLLFHEDATADAFYYIKHGATSLDLYILFHTFKTMLLGRGAQ